jgi:hypothetical protein
LKFLEFIARAPKKVREADHLPSGSDVVAEIGALVSALNAKKIRPAVIAICNSCVRAYCPEEYARFIEEEEREALKD